MKLRDERDLLLERLESGVRRGIYKFYKYEEKPMEETVELLVSHITEAAMLEIDDTFVFERAIEE